ncbi:lysophospholipid acyltransferase family protein [Algoriphagus hitonicola]|uniref:1-acyl-sn-glycerol-3-phosphate acyltransferase n=1 Tax=Algoriphagus hitonicola TaxID=435880 RepID=A0A1I2TMM0_9BACT|nr:lysophospholipid acyltransferase family protein [Algoriphagus hitonicola]SFG66154.1 1-acyl-sn-glycerol-3-phosphate acyltransferase [Algoriphagus hitonicola]
MSKLIRKIYTVYAGLLFVLSFLIIFPFFLICIWVPGWQRLGRKINRYWAKVYFTLIFLPVQVDQRARLENGKAYIFLANHFSYLDIAMMGFIPGDVQFVGKASIRKVPLFGYYFKKLHIAVDRSRLKSRAETMRRAALALDQKSSIVLFPEGGIYTQNPPKMIPFKNGAFRLAIEKQIPIIPVTLSYNHLILPDDSQLLLNFKKAKMVIHEAIYPSENLTEQDLRDLCFAVIQGQLDHDNQVKKEVPTLEK